MPVEISGEKKLRDYKRAGAMPTLAERPIMDGPGLTPSQQVDVWRSEHGTAARGAITTKSAVTIHSSLSMMRPARL